MKIKMNSKYIIGVMVASAMTMTSCSNFTEIDAKGNNLLASVTDLELLLNAPAGYDYDNGINFGCDDMSDICNDYLYAYSLISTSINVVVPTAKSIRWTWDEEKWVANMPELTKTDDWYTGCYYYVGRIANPILSKIDAAEGDESKKALIKAEAYVVRAYYHWIALQRFAPAYNPANASSTIALSYITEDMDIKAPSTPVTMEEFYNKLNADLDAAIALDALPDRAINQTRFSRAAMYAVKALVLMSMQNYEEAASYADKALASNNAVTDYNSMLTNSQIRKTDTAPLEDYPVFNRPRLGCDEDYYTMYGTVFSSCITPFAQSNIEPGHIYMWYLDNSARGRDESEKDRLSTNRLGDPGYIMVSGSNDYWYPPFGLRSTQMYFIKAENAIRKGNYDEAMGYLDIVRVKRIRPDMYTALQGTVNDKTTAIKYLKMSYQSEGLFSIWNFVNRKRWNVQDADWQETITRTLAGRTMTLKPDSKLWVFPIPESVINNNPNFKPFLND